MKISKEVSFFKIASELLLFSKKFFFNFRARKIGIYNLAIFSAKIQIFECLLIHDLHFRLALKG